MQLQKATDTAKRSYNDACGAAHALDLAGERWALLVIRELIFGPKRFSDLRTDLPGISANVLTQRLEGLEAAGVLLRRRFPPPAATQVYELTPWGYEAEPIFVALGRWAARSPAHDPTLPLSAVSLMLSFRTMFDATRADGFKARVGFRLPRDGFVARAAKGRLRIRREEPREADVDALLAGPPPAVAAAAYGGVPLDQLETDGLLGLTGDRALAARFLSLFLLPPKAVAAPGVAD